MYDLLGIQLGPFSLPVSVEMPVLVARSRFLFPFQLSFQTLQTLKVVPVFSFVYYWTLQPGPFPRLFCIVFHILHSLLGIKTGVFLQDNAPNQNSALVRRMLWFKKLKQYWRRRSITILCQILVGFFFWHPNELNFCMWSPISLRITALYFWATCILKKIALSRTEFWTVYLCFYVCMCVSFYVWVMSHQWDWRYYTDL